MPRSVQPGNHIKVGRGLYDHHGIYMGVRGGVHAVAELAKPADGGRVRLVSWNMFGRGSRVEIVDHPEGLPLDAVVANVLHTRRWRRYGLLDWNCEHFATWCATHQPRSTQVEGAVRVGIGVLVLSLLCQFVG